jgi:hypothetical protein
MVNGLKIKTTTIVTQIIAHNNEQNQSFQKFFIS